MVFSNVIDAQNLFLLPMETIPIDSVLVVVLKVESVKKKCTPSGPLRARGYIIAAGASILSNKAARVMWIGCGAAP